MKTAVIQINAGGDRSKNIAKALRHVQKAARNGAKFILLPEAFSFRGRANRQNTYSHIAENIPGPSTNPLRALAKKHRIHIHAGSVCERIPRSKKVYNTSVLIGPKGAIIAKYRKVHLFDAVLGKKTLKESKKFRAGTRGATACIGSFKLGLSICYDLRFPEMYVRYAKKGVNAFCVPSAFTKKTGMAHWEILLRARAIENLSYVLAPNQIGQDSQGVASYGHSMIIDPWGKVLARASGHKEEVIYANLDPAVLRKSRAILPAAY